jgi:hypothetical protein
MKLQVVLGAVLALSTTAAFAATSDITSTRRADFTQAGTHQFYAHCADGQDRVLREQGRSAKDAQTRLQLEHVGCHFSWQGRIHA